MTTTHILVDFENVQPDGADVALVHDPQHRLWLFRGPNQTRYKADFAEALLALGGRVQVIRCAKSGRNALDMHIAFHIGRLIGGAAAPAGEAADAFVVVSSDTDYAPVLEYVRSLGYEARSVPNLPAALGAAKGRRAKKAPAATAKAEPRGAPNEGHVGDRKRGDGKAGDRPGGRREAKQEAKQEARHEEAKQAAAPQAKRGDRQAAKQPAKAPAARTAAKKAPSKVAAAEVTPRAPTRRGGRGRGSALTSERAGERADDGAGEGAAPVAVALLGKLAADLAGHPNSRPTRLAKLRSWLLARSVPATDVEATIEALQTRGALRLQQTRVEYPG